MLRSKLQLPTAPSSPQSPSSPSRLESNMPRSSSTSSSSSNSKQRKTYGILEDLLLMLVLHFVIFFIYAAMCTPDINIDPHPNGIQVQNPLQAQLQKFKQTLQTSSTALTNTITNPYNLNQLPKCPANLQNRSPTLLPAQE